MTGAQLGRREGSQIEARSTFGGRGKRTPANTPLFLSWSFVRGSCINTGFPFPGNNFKTMQLFLGDVTQRSLSRIIRLHLTNLQATFQPFLSKEEKLGSCLSSCCCNFCCCCYISMGSHLVKSNNAKDSGKGFIPPLGRDLPVDGVQIKLY